jgi:serine/threonine protein kinase
MPNLATPTPSRAAVAALVTPCFRGPRRLTVAPPAVPTDPRPGQTLGHYLLTGLLGEGGSSRVFRAMHVALGRTVAVKLPPPGLLARHPDLAAQFRREARLLARLDHPNVVRVLDGDEAGGLPFLVLEHIDGLSLLDLIRHCGRLRWDQAVSLGARLADGLAALHRLGIVHRDVKPSNILVGRDGAVKLADLGLARPIGEPDDGPVGTLAYCAPEQLTPGMRVDHRADLYALGVTLYQAVTGELPFPANSADAITAAHLREPAPLLRLTATDVPLALCEMVQRLMAKSPARRFPTAERAAAALAALRPAADETAVA